MEDVRNDVAELLNQSKHGWVKSGDQWYYYYDDGKKAIGWATIDKKKYYFNADGVMQTGWIHEGNKWYYLKKNGSMAVGWIQDENKWYYLAKDGVMQKGWIKDKGYKYYLDKSGAMQNGWVTIGKKVYYFHPAGDMAVSEWIYDKDPSGNNKGYYRIEANGRFTYPYIGEWIKKSGKWMFKDSNGWYPKNRTLKIKGVIYAFDKDGYLIED